MTYRFSVVAQPFTNVPIDFLGFYSSFQGSAGQQAATSFTIQTTNSSVSTYSTFQSYFFGNCGAPTCLQYTTFNNTTFTSSRPDIFNVNGSFQGTLGMLTGADGTVSGSVQLFAGANTSVNAGSASWQGNAPDSLTSYGTITRFPVLSSTITGAMPVARIAAAILAESPTTRIVRWLGSMYFEAIAETSAAVVAFTCAM